VWACDNLQRVEGGQENLTFDSMVKMASKLGVRVIELFRVSTRPPMRQRIPLPDRLPHAALG